MVFAFAIVLALIGAPALMLLMTSNRLIALDQRCNTAFADIDVHLKHRHDLIPGLVKTVGAYAAHEKTILVGITKARAKALAAVTPEMKLEAEKNLSQTIVSLISSADRFPDLQASSHFRELRQELSDSESRISASRRFYNLAIEEFNATLKQFPGNFVGQVRRLAARRPFDLGIERVLIDEPIAIKF